MTPETQFRITPQVVIGLLIIGLGVTWTADNVGWIDGWRLMQWFWPAMFLGVGLTVLFGADVRSGRILGAGLSLVGVALVADRLGWLRFSIHDWWPIALVVFGLSLISRAGRTRDTSLGANDGAMSAFAFWSGVRRRIVGNFKRAELTAIMGGIEIDLRGATLPGGEAVVDVFAVWGGIEITVPPDWDVSNQAMAIMGGVDDKSGGSDQRRTVGGVVATGPGPDWA